MTEASLKQQQFCSLRCLTVAPAAKGGLPLDHLEHCRGCSQLLLMDGGDGGAYCYSTMRSQDGGDGDVLPWMVLLPASLGRIPQEKPRPSWLEAGGCDVVTGRVDATAPGNTVTATAVLPVLRLSA